MIQNRNRRRRGGFGRLTLLIVGGGVLVAILWTNGYLRPFGLPFEHGIPDQPSMSSVAPEASWTCDWSPTMNDDWHDDVLCTRGAETIRPVLRPDSAFVTEDDMRQAGREYEASLNQ